jgi:hypothetical protein
MHHHNQTIADLERQDTPSAWQILAGVAIAAAAVYLALAFAFSL